MKIVAKLVYDTQKRIGVAQGQNGAVYLSKDPQLGGVVAVKVIDKRVFGDDVDRFFTEAQGMYASSHEHVVPVLAASQDDHHVLIAMPFLPNGSLQDRIEETPLSLREVVRVGIGVAHGLAQIHQSGYVHFDVKPANVLFDEKWVPMLADFGCCGRMGRDGVAQAPGLYQRLIPPESLSTFHGAPASDVYQAGVLLYRAANGEPWYQRHGPPKGMSLKDAIKAGTFPRRDRYMPHVPRELRTVLNRAMSIDLRRRYRTAAELERALGRLVIPVDWAVRALGDGGTAWSSAGGKKATRLVEMRREAGARWGIDTRVGKLRRQSLCSSGLTQIQAYKFLDRCVFRELA